MSTPSFFVERWRADSMRSRSCLVCVAISFMNSAMTASLSPRARSERRTDETSEDAGCSVVVLRAALVMYRCTLLSPAAETSLIRKIFSTIYVVTRGPCSHRGDRRARTPAGRSPA